MDDLRGERFRLLCSQLEKEHGWGWQRKYAKIFGLKQNHISQMEGRKRAVTLQTIEKVIEGMSIAREFFTDPKLGPAPDHRDFVGRPYLSGRATINATATGAMSTATRESHVTRDPIDESSMDQWTVFTHTAEYKRARPEAIAVALKLRNLGLDLSVGQYIKFIENKDAEASGKAVHEPEIKTGVRPGRMTLKK